LAGEVQAKKPDASEEEIAQYVLKGVQSFPGITAKQISEEVAPIAQSMKDQQKNALENRKQTAWDAINKTKASLYDTQKNAIDKKSKSEAIKDRLDQLVKIVGAKSSNDLITGSNTVLQDWKNGTEDEKALAASYQELAKGLMKEEHDRQGKVIKGSGGSDAATTEASPSK
jgi:hypothetical protein